MKRFFLPELSPRLLLLLFFTCISLHICSAAAAPAVNTQTFIRAQDGRASMIFLESEPLHFQLQEPLDEFTVSVSDYRDREICTVNGSGTKFTVPALECGYYRLRLSGRDGERGFAVLKPRTDSRRENRSPSPYGVDLALYNQYDLQGDPMGGVRLLTEICGQLGVGIVRNRLVWNLVENDPAGNILHGTGEVAGILHAAGIESTLTFHDAPARFKRTSDAPFPDDLGAVYEFCRQLAASMPEISVWEFWNEQDMLNGREFAAAQKAAYLGFKAGNPAARVTPGSFFVYPFTADVELMFRNGIKDYCDIINCHLYLPLPEYPTVFRQIDELFDRYPLHGKALWITENGIYGDGDAEIDPGIQSEAPEQSPRQEMLWAEFVPKGHILSQAGGVERSFTFNLRRIQEGRRQWGLLRPDFSVKPAAVTLAVLNRELGDASYLGELAAPEGVRAFLFAQRDGSQSIALWLEGTLDKSMEKFFPKEKVGEILSETLILDGSRLLRASSAAAANAENAPQIAIVSPAAPISICNAFGSALPFETKGGALYFEASNFVIYLHGLSGLQPETVRRHSAASTDASAGAREADAATDLNKNVILQATPGDSAGVMTLSVWNLSPEPVTGMVECSAPQIGLPQKIEVPAMGKYSVETKVERNAEEREITFHGVFNGRKCSTLAVPYPELKLYQPEPAPVFLQQNAWKPNSSGAMKIEFDHAEQSMVFHTEFTPGSDRWSYPYFEPATAAAALDGAFGIAFEMKEDAPTEEVERSTTYLCWIDGKRYPIEPSFGQWTQCVLFFPEHPEKIEKISFGLNPRYDNLTFRLRNFRLLR